MQNSSILARYGKAEKELLDNRGFINLDKFEIPRRDVNLIRKPFFRRLGPKFELSRERTHMVWRGDDLASHIRCRAPRPRRAFKNLTETYHWWYVNERSEITPQNVHPDRITTYKLLLVFISF